MAAYMIVQLTVNDAEKYSEYRKQVLPTIAQFGGHVRAADDQPAIIEGEWPASATILIEWPSVERAQEWYDSDVYAAPKALRLSASSANLIFLRGLPGR